ncbi:hypothetical protein [Brucella intermedia]|uniref:hypothetical protein n=1 Tax=Brucella intermedia TaxID=94625 RepID=UPI00165D134F|nr:hypothetical protein [Brucella intermedia]QNQ43008.1 hypothetical protein IAR37_16280 [Brucella intermedia]
MASEDLLKKAVAAFNALSPEQQAEMLEEQRQSWVRGNVGLSRDERGMTSPVMPRPAPAATDTGLVTVAQAYVNEDGECEEIAWIEGLFPHPECIQLVTRSQAEELLAAERADKRIWMEKAAIEAERVQRLEADNAAQAARIKELDRCHEGTIDLCNHKTAQIEALEAKLAAAEKALTEADEALQADAIASAHAAIRAALGGKPS